MSLVNLETLRLVLGRAHLDDVRERVEHLDRLVHARFLSGPVPGAMSAAVAMYAQRAGIANEQVATAAYYAAQGWSALAEEALRSAAEWEARAELGLPTAGVEYRGE